MYKLFTIVVVIGLAVLFVLSCGRASQGQRGPLAGEVNYSGTQTSSTVCSPSPSVSPSSTPVPSHSPSPTPSVTPSPTPTRTPTPTPTPTATPKPKHNHCGKCHKHFHIKLLHWCK